MQLLLFGFATAILVMDKTPQHLKLPKKKWDSFQHNHPCGKIFKFPYIFDFL